MSRLQGRPRVGFLQLDALGLLIPRSRTPFGGAEVRAVTFAEMLLDSGRFDVTFAVLEEPGSAIPAMGRRGMAIHTLPIQTVESLPGLGETAWGPGDPLCGALADMRAQILVTLGANEVSHALVRYAQLLGSRSVVGIASDQSLGPAVFRGSMVVNEYGIPHGHAWGALHGADMVLTQTTSQADSLYRQVGRRGILVPNPIPAGWESLRAARRGSFAFDFLWVGRGGADKNPDILFEAARELPAARFRVVMNGGIAGIPRAWRGNLPDNVLVSDRLNGIQAQRDLIADSRAMVNTSPFEGFPNLMLQGAMLGCPTLFLCADPDGWGSEHGCAASALGDFERFLAHLHRALRDAPWLETMAARALERAMARHTAAAVRAKLAAALNQAFAGPGVE